jgi:hypothetical protein
MSREGNEIFQREFNGIGFLTSLPGGQMDFLVGPDFPLKCPFKVGKYVFYNRSLLGQDSYGVN